MKHIHEITIEPPLRDALEEALRPFLAERVNGTTLARYLQHRRLGDDDLRIMPPALTLRMTQAIDQALALHGGQAILEALEGIAHDGGAPCVVLRGLPHGVARGGLMPIFAEALRQWIRPQPESSVHITLKDTYLPFIPPSYLKSGVMQLHQDQDDVSILYPRACGANPRPTVVHDAESLMAAVADAAHRSAPHRDRDALLVACEELFQLPVWETNERHRSTLHNTMEAPPVPSEAPVALIAPNPAAERSPSASRYRFIKVPELITLFASRYQVKSEKVPPHLQRDAALIGEAMMHVACQRTIEQPSVLLGQGDMMIINQHLTLHAGGKHRREFLSALHWPQPRRMTAVDVWSEARDYPVQPGERWQDAIVPADGKRAR